MLTIFKTQYGCTFVVHRCIINLHNLNFKLTRIGLSEEKSLHFFFQTRHPHAAYYHSFIIYVYSRTGHLFNGTSFLRGNCGVSVMRSGEAMERGLRDCCRSMRIGKILIQTAEESEIVEAKVYYAKLPPNIEERKVLLMYPILGTFFMSLIMKFNQTIIT
ncbi:unnamed protein product [Trichobilharzia regenti]|nr:unnamed protein product [Trichobilharzia regenti]